MKYLITGGAGFAGSNIARKVLIEGHDLLIIDNLERQGAASNLDWLRKYGEFEFIEANIIEDKTVNKIFEKNNPDIIFHLAGQVAMTTSILDPLSDMKINLLGTLNILEAMKTYCKDSFMIFSSTNKVYGDLEYLNFTENKTRFICESHPIGFDEEINLEFHSPYGCSKGAADQYVLDYSRIYGINASVFRHSTMYGGRQFATADQGWIGWFCKKGLEIQKGIELGELEISGTGKQVRDILHSSDVVDLYMLAAKNPAKINGKAFNVGGGVENSISILELFIFLEEELEIKVDFTKLPQRESDQKVFISDNSKISNYLDWQPQISLNEGLREQINWLKKAFNEA